MANDVTIQASMLAVGGSIIMDPEDPTALSHDFVQRVGVLKRNLLTITGSLIARDGIKGANFVNSAATEGGFAKTVIGSETQTGTVAPPLFPQTGSGALKVDNWDEFTTTVDPNAGLTFPVPGASSGSGSTGDNAPLVVVIPRGGDSIAPVTSSNAMPSYNGQAVITLSVADASNTGAGDVWRTWYRISGDPTTHVGRTVVVPPIADNTVETMTVTYWSQDRAGNMEAPHTVSFVMRGRDTLPPFTTVEDSDNPSQDLPNGYPQIGDPAYVVWGDFVPQFSATEAPSGLGVNQIFVSLDVNGVPTDLHGVPTTDAKGAPATTWTIWTGSQTPLNFAPVQAPTVGSVQLHYKYFAYDKAGNREEARTLTVTQRALDVQGPFVTHDAPSSGLFVGDATIRLTADDGPEGQGVRNVRYSLDNGDWVTVPNVTVTRSMVLTVRVPAPALGRPPVSHTLVFVSTDAATDRYHQPSPNSGNPQMIALLVGPAMDSDVTPPESSSDAQSSYVGPATINLFSSDQGGVAAIHWQLDGGATQTGATVYVDSPWSGTAPHHVSFWAVDTAGNIETPKTVTFDITPENEKPVTSAHNSDVYSVSPAVFQLTAQDNEGGSGLKATYYRIDGGAPQLGATTPLGLTWVAVDGDGQHHVDFWSVDNANNVEAAKSADFLVDTTPPSTLSDSVSTTYVGQAIIRLTASDAGSGVAYTRWRNTADGNEQVANPVLLGPGSWDVDYWSVDKAGNSETPKRLHVTVLEGPDTYAPRSYDDIKPFYKAGSNPAELHLFSWDVQTGVQTMFYILDGGQTRSMAGLGIPPASYLVTATGDQTHTIEYWAIDRASPGNLETPHQKKTFQIDTGYPVTTCSARAGGDYWSAQNFTLQAADSGSGIDGTYYTLDGGVTIKGTSVYVPTPRAVYSVPHVIRYWSVDRAGNVETARSVSFTSHPLDTIAPTTYSNAKPSYAGSAIVSLLPYDNIGGSGVAETRYILDSGRETVGTLVLAMGSGAHTLEFWSIDKAGNIELPHKSVSYLVDYFGPTTMCDALRWYNSSPVSVHLTAQALGGGANPANTFYRLDGAAAMGGTVPITIVAVSGEGTHTLEYWSTDGYGNVEAAKSATFGIDTQSPHTTSNAVGSYEGTAAFTLVSKDEVGGSAIKNTYWKVQGGGTQTGVSVSLRSPGSSTVATSVYFWSEDNAGNVESAHKVDFTIGPLAPMTFSALSPAENSTIAIRNPVVSMTATSTVSEIVSATGMIDGVPQAVTFAHPLGSWVTTMTWVPGVAQTGTTVLAGSAFVNIGTDPTGGTQWGGSSNWSSSYSHGMTFCLQSAFNLSAYSSVTAATLSWAKTGYTANEALTVSVDGTTTLQSWLISAQPTSANAVAITTYAKANAGKPSVVFKWMSPRGDADAGSWAYMTGMSSPALTVTGTKTTVGSWVPSTVWQPTVVDTSTANVSFQTQNLLDGEHWASYTFTNAVGQKSTKTWRFTVSAPRDTLAPITTALAGGLLASGAGSQAFDSDQTFVVPVGITAVTVDVYGAEGGPSSVSSAGNGDGVHAVLPVTPGQALSVVVGGMGSGYDATGGYPDGGGSSSSQAGGGGGSTSVWLGGTAIIEARGGDGGGLLTKRGLGGGSSFYSGTNGVVSVGANSGDGRALITWSVAGSILASGPTPVTLVAVDEAGGTGVASTNYKLDAGSTQSGTPPTTTVLVTGEGSHKLQFWSTDYASNVETAHTVDVVIDMTAPITTSDALPTYKGSATVSLSATDRGSGVKATYYAVERAGSSAPGFSVTGGEKSVDGSRTVITFRSSGSLVCSGSLSGASVLVVGGGGGGADNLSGGGGGGGVVTRTIDLSGTMNIAVGAGGAASGSYYDDYNEWDVRFAATNGSPSSIGTVTALGGGHGGQRDIPDFATSGGSGGGGAGAYRGNAAGGSGTSGQGNNGGNGTGPNSMAEAGGGGGGGAGAPGGNGSFNTGGSGGIGLVSSIGGTPQYFGGGGGGGSYYNPGFGGLGGGGMGQPSLSAGQPNTGGGGGAGADGGSGIVIISYPTSSGVVQTGNTVKIDGPLNGDPVSYDLRYWSVDNVGNIEAARSVSFSISAYDITPPQTVADVHSPYNATSTITLKATDAGSGVDYTKYRLTKDGAPGALTTGTVLSTGGQGSYRLEFWSVDKMGNKETTQTADYVVDMTPPTTTTDAAPTIIVAPTSTVTPSTAGTVTYNPVNNPTGGDQVFTVPQNITSLNVDLYGAQGGTTNDWSTTGGYGGHVKVALPVTPGTTLTIRVGTSKTKLPNVPWLGSGSNGWPNGGAGGSASGSYGGGYGGGGSTQILTSAGRVLAEAGGGGGATIASFSGLAGSPGGSMGNGLGAGSSTGFSATPNYGGGGGGWTGGAAGTSGSAAKGGTSWVASGTLIGAYDVGVRGVSTGKTNSLSGLAVITYGNPATTVTTGGWAMVRLFATDNHPGSSGVQSTYYTVDGGVQTAGTSIPIQGPASGSAVHHLHYWSKDWANNTESPAKETTFTLKAESAPMVWSAWSPAKLSIVGVRNPTISVKGTATGENITAAVATFDGVSVTSTMTRPVSSDLTQAITQFSTSALQDGTHTVTFTYTGSSGREAIESWSFTVAGPDNAPPTTTSNAKLSYEGTATITLSAIDSWSGVKATYYKLDGLGQTTGTVITVAPPQYGGPVTHNIRFWSVDNLDNVEAANSATFTVAPSRDTTAPTTTSDLKPVYDGLAVIALQAQDNPGGWGVANTYYKLDGSGPAAYTVPISVDPPSSASATHTLEFWSIDRAGNEESHTVGPFKINSLADYTAPITSVEYQRYYNNTSSTIRLTATDNKYGSGVDYTKYRKIWNGAAGALTTGTVLPTGGEGAYHLEFWSIDKASNKEDTKSVDYWVDLTAPVTSSNASSTYAGPASIMLGATDGTYGSGVYYTQYMVDDTLPWTIGNVVNVADPIAGSQTHHVDYRSVDWAGNWEVAKTATFTINALPAAVVFSEWSPAKLSIANVRNPVVSVRGKAPTNITNVTATLDGYAVTPSRYYNGGQTDCTALFNTSNLSDAVHTVSFTYTIASGARSTESWSFTVSGPDNVAPTTTSDAQPAYEGTATIHLFPVDTWSGVKATYYVLNGDIQRSGTTIIVAPPAYGTVTRTLTFWSVDNQNNTESPTTVSLTITAPRDTTPPNTVSDVASPYSGTAHISLTASDNVGGWGFNSTEYRVAMVSPTPSNGTTQTSGIADTVIPTIQGPTTGSATYRLYFRSVDRAGNAETAKWADFTINAAPDNVPPVTGISASPRYSGPSTIYLYPTDVGQGVRYTHYILTGGASSGLETSGTAIPTGSQGSYTLQYWSKDWAGNQEVMQPYAYVVDQTPPTTTSNRVETYSVSATMLLTAVDNHPGYSGVSYTSYKIDGGATKTFIDYGLPISPFVSSVTIPRFYAAGAPEAHQLQFWSTDKVGWSESAKTVTFTINATADSTPPDTTTDRKPFCGGPSIIKLTAVDSGWGVAYTNYKLDNGSVMTGTLAGTGGSGNHTLYYWSTDNAIPGNVEAQKSTTFTVDTTPPVTSIVATATAYSGSASISLTATDPLAGSGVVATYYRVDDGSQIQYTGPAIFIAGPISGTAAHHLDFWSIDAVSNTESPRTATFTITATPDNTAPALSDNHSTAYTKPATMTLTAADAGWGVASIRYQLDGGSVVTAFTTSAGGIASASCLVGTGGGTPSLHTLTYWASDQSGNTATATITYTVAPDTTPPATTSNRQPLYTSGPAVIVLTPVDTGWGVQYTHFRLNGGAETSGTYIVVPDPLTGSTDSTLTFWSIDWANNTETAHTETFTVKAVPATMSFSGIAPADGSNIGTTTAAITISAYSNQAVSSATLALDTSTRALSSFVKSGVSATAILNVTGLSAGLHTVSVTFTGADGRQNSKAWTFTCTPRTDYTPPITLSDVKSSYFGTATVILTPADEPGGSGVDYTRYKVDGGAWTTGTLPSTAIVVAPPSSGAPVDHTIYFWSADHAGNPESMNTKTFKVGMKDVTAPVSTSNAVLYYKAPGTILFISTDLDGSGVAASYYMLDHDTTGTLGTMVGTGGVGQHTLTFWAVDYAGNVEKPNTFDYIVDETAPHTSSDAKPEYAGAATIRLNPQDELDGSGIKGTFYRVDDGGQVSGAVISVAPPLSGSVAHKIYFWSVDNAGNVEQEQSAAFNVKAVPDQTPPITSIDYRTAYAVPGLITLSAVDNDGGWGVASTHYILDSNAEAQGLLVRTGGPGSHTLKYWSVDKGDNYESVKTVTYTVLAQDTMPPSTTSDALTEYVGSAKISLTATDNSGAASVTYYQLDAGDITVGTVVNVPGPASGTESHTLNFWSVDINGVAEVRTAARNTVRFTNTMLPASMTFSGVSPLEASMISIRNPLVTVTAIGLKVIAGGTLAVDGVARTPKVTLNGTTATMTYPANFLASSGTGVVHTVSAVFTDASGGVATKAWSFTVKAPADITAPKTTSNGTPTYRAPAAITLVSTDETGGSGVAFTYYVLDGASQVVGTPPTTTITVPDPGPHSLEYWSVDAEGNVELQHNTLGFNVDLTAPHTSSDVLLAYEGDAVISLTPDDFAKGSGIAGTHYIVDTGIEQSGTVVTVPAPISGNQWHNVYFWSFDRAGNVEMVQDAYINVWAAQGITPQASALFSASAPISLAPPTTVSDAAATYSAPGVIHLTATGGDKGDGATVAHTYYALDGGAQIESTVVGTGGAGSHTLRFWSVDGNGTLEPQNTVTYVVGGSDAVAPATVSDAVATYQGTGQINLSAADNIGGSGVAHTYYRWDGGPQTESTIIGVAGSGTHTVTFWSVDWAGNVESVKTANFDVVTPDVTAPTTIADLQPSYTGTATVALTALDNAGGAGVRATFYRLDGGALQTGTSVQVPSPASGSASHSIQFWSVDNMNNSETEKTVSFIVNAVPDITAPVTKSDATGSYTGTATIALTAADEANGSGVKSTYYRIDTATVHVGASIEIAAPPTGSASHTISFWSVDNSGNTEAVKTHTFTVAAVAAAAVVTGEATIVFRWEPTNHAWANLHYETASGGTWLGQVKLSGYGSDLDWTMTVPAGKQYRLVCDYWEEEGNGSDSGLVEMTPALTPGQTFVWSY